MIAGNDDLSGTPTWPCSITKVQPAAYALSAYMPPLNSRCATSRPRRALSTETAPTIAAPTGPSRTTEASVAEELGDQADLRGIRGVGVESQTRNSRASTLSWNQLIFEKGPRATCTEAATTTSAM